MHIFKTLMITGVALPLMAGGALASSEQPRNFKLGSGILSDDKGKPMYIYDQDHDGMSACYKDCVRTWPPVLASDKDAPVGDYTIIKREDGSKQWAYKGRALYVRAGDSRNCEVTESNQDWVNSGHFSGPQIECEAGERINGKFIMAVPSGS